MRIIVALSGGKASAWCAGWAFRNFLKQNVVLYFNDTKWEHSDLYRFLSDIELYFDHEIIRDSDGRSPEDLFYDHRALANNRMPFCSQELKAQRLQRYCRDGDILVFGIGPDEAHRAQRIVDVYSGVQFKSGKNLSLRFPLISESVTREKVNQWLLDTGIAEPSLYTLGFSHNNCSGGCVRAGKKQWKLLYEKLPGVYLDRERVEEEMREFTGKDIHILPDETLRRFRGRIESGNLSRHYDDVVETETECVGICQSMA